MERARVFISCGQRDDSRELNLARQIETLLREKEYCPFLAKQIQTLGALTDEIYRQLAEAEYFLFVDFKRDPIALDSPQAYRGSLFSHQELAIASFLEKECLVFRERGVELEGIQRFILSNPVEFSTDTQLVNAIETEVGQRWNPDWRSELQLSLPTPRYQDAVLPASRAIDVVSMLRSSRWYHVQVKNRHRTKHAVNCFGFLENIECGPNRKNVQVVWAGTQAYSVVILPGDTRELDAFHWLADTAGELRFHTFATSGYYYPTPIDRAGVFNLTFRVVSDNFPDVRATFRLSWDGDINHLSFETIPT